MRLLLDTHILLWALTGDAALPRGAASLLADPAIDVSASAVNIWEIAIKFALNRGAPGDMPVSSEVAMRLTREATYDIVPIEPEHAAGVAQLPLIHGDPFDRLLIAQSRHEGVRLLTHDDRLARYGDDILLV